VVETQSVPDVIRARLSAGERVLWCGQMPQGLTLRTTDKFSGQSISIWSILAWAGCVFISWGWRPGGDAWWLLGGAALMLIGIVGILVSDAQRRARIHYALTSERVIVAGRAWRDRVQSISLSTLSALSLAEGRNGRGTVSFRGERNDTVTLGAEKNALLEFSAIADSRRVFELIRDAQKRILEQQPGGQQTSAEAVERDRIPDAIDADLSAGEQVLWLGQPRQGLMLRPVDAFVVPFSLILAALIGWACWQWIASVISGKGTPHPDASGFWVVNGVFVLLVLIMFYVLVGRFFVAARRRARTHYALTSERVLIARGRCRLQSVNLRTLSDLPPTKRSDGRGTIWLVPTPPSEGMAEDVFGSTPPRLDLIPDAQRVYQMIRDAQCRLV